PAAHCHSFAEDLYLLPAVGDAVLCGVERIGFFDVEIRLVGANDGKAPGDALVVADGDSRQAGFAAADDVPTWGVEVDEVTQRRQCDGPMRIAGQERLAGRR